MKSESMLRAGGRPNKGGASPKMSVVMTRDMIDKIEIYAKKNGITKGEAVRQCIREVLG